MSDHEAGGELIETAGSSFRLTGASAMVLQGSVTLPPKLKVGGVLSQANVVRYGTRVKLFPSWHVRLISIE